MQEEISKTEEKETQNLYRGFFQVLFGTTGFFIANIVNDKREFLTSNVFVQMITWFFISVIFGFLLAKYFWKKENGSFIDPDDRKKILERKRFLWAYTFFWATSYSIGAPTLGFIINTHEYASFRWWIVVAPISVVSYFIGFFIDRFMARKKNS